MSSTFQNHWSTPTLPSSRKSRLVSPCTGGSKTFVPCTFVRDVHELCVCYLEEVMDTLLTSEMDSASSRMRSLVPSVCWDALSELNCMCGIISRDQTNYPQHRPNKRLFHHVLSQARYARIFLNLMRRPIGCIGQNSILPTVPRLKTLCLSHTLFA